MHALDLSSRQKSQCGNTFMIAAGLEGEFDLAAFENEFGRYCLSFPQLEGRICRDWNLAPYWKFPGKNTLRANSVKKMWAENTAQAFAWLRKELNEPWEKGYLPVKAAAAWVNGETLLGFIFDHRFFDARGAEMFLQRFQDAFLKGHYETFSVSPAPACLDRWSEQFAAGKKVNRAKIAREKNLNLDSLAGSVGENRFKVKCFSAEETAQIFKRAEEAAGPFLFLPYALAQTVRAMRQLFDSRGKSGDMIVPLTRDMRGGAEHLLFNHLSFLFFKINAEESRDPERLLKNLKIQFYEQVKNKMAEALAEASMLMRVAPLSLLAASPARTSFSFASVGESAYRHEFLMKARIKNMVHMPRIPEPPGAGFFLSQFRGRLNLVFSYDSALMTETEADRVFETAVLL